MKVHSKSVKSKKCFQLLQFSAPAMPFEIWQMDFLGVKKEELSTLLLYFE